MMCTMADPFSIQTTNSGTLPFWPFWGQLCCIILGLQTFHGRDKWTCLKSVLNQAKVCVYRTFTGTLSFLSEYVQTEMVLRCACGCLISLQKAAGRPPPKPLALPETSAASTATACAQAAGEDILQCLASTGSTEYGDNGPNNSHTNFVQQASSWRMQSPSRLRKRVQL